MYPMQGQIFYLNTLLMFITFFALGSVAEEMIFRGFYFKNALKENKKWFLPIIIFQALLFTMVHINNPEFNWSRVINIFMVSIILGFVAIKGFIYVVVFHFLWNFIQAYVLGVGVSGYLFNGSWNVIQDVPAWESSIVASVVLLPVVVYFIYDYSRNQKQWA